MGVVIPFRSTEQWETLRKARAHVAEAWRMKLESATVKRGYEERRRGIEEVLARIRDEVEGGPLQRDR